METVYPDEDMAGSSAWRSVRDLPASSPSSPTPASPPSPQGVETSPCRRAGSPGSETGHFVRLGCRIRRLMEDGELTDVVLRAGDVQISTHRLVLAANSEYFHRMFAGNLSEKFKSVIEMRDIDSDALKSLISFCYSGQVKIDEENVEALFSAAAMIRMTKVEELCEEFLRRRLSESNALGVRRFADLHSARSLHHAAHNFITRNFLTVCESGDFLELEPRELGPLLDSDDLNIDSELDVFQALMRWYQARPAERGEALGRLLQCIRLVQLPREVLVELHEREPVFRDHAECHELYVEALKATLSPEKHLATSSRSQPRKATLGFLYAFGGQDHSKGPMTIERYDPREDSWSSVGRMSGRRQQFGVAVLGGRVVVVGGRDGLKTLGCFEAWDPTCGQWSQLPPLRTPRHGLAVAVLEGPLYAVGGHDGWSYLSSVERWDPEANTWTRVEDMHCARSTAAVAVLNGRLYVAGGRDSSHPLDSVEAYNPHTNKWAQVARMIRRRSSLALCAAQGCLWALGGVETQVPSPNPPTSRLASLERYDPETETWTLIAAGMSLGREGMGVAVLGDALFAVGGYDGGRFLPTLEAYHIPTKTWRKWGEMKSGRTGAGCVVLPKTQRRQYSTSQLTYHVSTSAIA